MSSSPSKSKGYTRPPSRSQTPPRSRESPPWKTLQWILFGFGIGAATTALLQSVSMPSVRIEWEYEDAPEVELHHHYHTLRILDQENPDTGDWSVRSETVVDEKTTDDETDQGVNHDEDDEVKKEREEIQHSLKEEDLPNDNQFIEEAANDNSENDNEEEEEEEIEDKPGDDEPDFSNPGPPPKLEPGEGFAACILIKDDNHWLIEWLAYHWFVMPLRYLIVAIDPDSKTSPIPILQRWKDRKLMTISIWGDDMFMPNKIKAKPHMFDNNTELMMHRVRQNNFYFKCMRTFKQRNREWLMLTDTDEYIVTNYASGLYHNLTKNIPITKRGNVLTFIKQHHEITGENHTCSYMPRYMFGFKESTNPIVQRHVARTGLNGQDFLTQRFVYRNPRRMHNGKNLINIKMLPQIKTYSSVHHVSSYCPNPDEMRTVNHVKKALVRVHHYLGTEEQYLFRSDPRQQMANVTNKKKASKGKTNAAYFTRGKARYLTLNKRSNYPDHGARAWIRGFVEHVGLEKAKELLEGVGKVGYE